MAGSLGSIALNADLCEKSACYQCIGRFIVWPWSRRYRSSGTAEPEPCTPDYSLTNLLEASIQPANPIERGAGCRNYCLRSLRLANATRPKPAPSNNSVEGSGAEEGDPPTELMLVKVSDPPAAALEK